jgi:hypothetical protein
VRQEQLITINPERMIVFISCLITDFVLREGNPSFVIIHFSSLDGVKIGKFNWEINTKKIEMP